MLALGFQAIDAEEEVNVAEVVGQCFEVVALDHKGVRQVF